MPGGGLLELSGHFEIQKVMYGFCSVKDPQAVLPKYVLVNWVSGGATWGGAVPTGAAVLAGAWLGVRKEPGGVRGGWEDAGAPWSCCPVVASGMGVTLLPLPGSDPPWLLQVGEDVPDARKCACASHVAKIAEFFQVGDTGEGDNAAGAPTLVPDGCSPHLRVWMSLSTPAAWRTSTQGPSGSGSPTGWPASPARCCTACGCGRTRTPSPW